MKPSVFHCFVKTKYVNKSYNYYIIRKMDLVNLRKSK